MQHRTFAFDTHHFEGALTEALVESGELAPQLLTQRQELAPRFADCYSHLCRLPRRTRRALQRQWKRSLAAIALLLALGQAPALAATIPVTPGTPPAINADGLCSLIEAMENANGGAIHADCVAGGGADIITLPAGSTQSLTEAHNGDNGLNGLPVVASQITIQGNGSTIRGTGSDFRILAVAAAGNLTLNNCTITRGNAYYLPGGGGGIANLGGTLTLNSSTVSNNIGWPSGGILNRGTLTLTNSTVSSNGARYYGGVENQGTMTMTDSAVSDNGARYVGGVSNDGSLTLTNSSISGNSVSRFVGGLDNRGSATLINSTVSKNTAYGLFSYYGSAGGVSNSGTLVLTNSTVSGNVGRQDEAFSAPGAGGIKNGGTLSVTNSTISANQSTTSTPSTFGGSGGITNAGKLILKRTLVSGNTGPDAAEILHDSGTVSANNFNLFGHSGDSGVVGFIPGANDLVPVETLNAILAALGNNGGPTETHALVPGSPALDAVERGCPPAATDQRGQMRPRDGDGDGTALCDTGAFERTVAASSCGGGPTSGCTVNGIPDQLCLGTPGPDVVLGTNANDVIQGLKGNDSIRGGKGNDRICGDAGLDGLFGEKGEDRLFGGLGNDILRGGDDNDRLSGNSGNDKLFGDNGNDALDGGSGPDTCDGGKGSGDSAVSCNTVLNVP